MKTASVLVGLITAACGARHPEPSYPLCDRQGAPACGNIGQVGRAEETPVAAALKALPAAAPRVAASTAIRIVPAVHVLLGASRERPLQVQARQITTGSLPLARPLADRREEIVCGNVMGKGSSRRVCRNAAGDIVSNTSLDPFED